MISYRYLCTQISFFLIAYISTYCRDLDILSRYIVILLPRSVATQYLCLTLNLYTLLLYTLLVDAAVVIGDLITHILSLVYPNRYTQHNIHTQLYTQHYIHT